MLKCDVVAAPITFNLKSIKLEPQIFTDIHVHMPTSAEDFPHCLRIAQTFPASIHRQTHVSTHTHAGTQASKHISY